MIYRSSMFINQRQSASPAVDWAIAPVHARWWAIEESGEAFWYCAPQIALLTGFWFCDQLPAPSFGFGGDWRTSLVERPASDRCAVAANG
jgi:hypothetical protein